MGALVSRREPSLVWRHHLYLGAGHYLAVFLIYMRVGLWAGRSQKSQVIKALAEAASNVESLNRLEELLQLAAAGHKEVAKLVVNVLQDVRQLVVFDADRARAGYEFLELGA